MTPNRERTRLIWSARAAVWEFMRPMLSPALVELNRDAFIVNESAETTVDLDGHGAASDSSCHGRVASNGSNG